MRLGHDLPISVNDRVIAQSREDFIFTKLRICGNKNLAKISEFTEYYASTAGSILATKNVVLCNQKAALFLYYKGVSSTGGGGVVNRHFSVTADLRICKM